MERIAILGCPGAGKTTLGRDLSARTGLPLIELDALYHQADWTPLPEREFVAQVRALIAGPRWIVDGNYVAVADLVQARADTVVWLDLPRRTTVSQLLWRTVRRLAFRERLFNGNRECLRGTLHLTDGLLAWAWGRHPVYRARYEARMHDGAWNHAAVHRLRSSADVHRFRRESEPS
ncbi:MAG: adenylate kinase [Myxococcota bacterium]